MKLLIEIPERKYNYFISNRNTYKRSIAESIINGRRLPDDCEILTKEAYSDLCMRASKGNCSEIPTGSEKLSSELEKNSKKLEKAATKNDLAVDVPDNNVGNIDCISRADARNLVVKIGRKDILGMSGKTFQDLYKGIDELPSVTPQEPIHGKCNQCKYYEGVHNFQGHAPCTYHRIGGVMWDWYCSQFDREIKE